MPQNIYRSTNRYWRPELPMILTGYQVLRKVTDTRGYLIPCRETLRKIGYIHFPIIIPLRLTHQTKMHAYPKAVRMKTSRQETASEKD